MSHRKQFQVVCFMAWAALTATSSAWAAPENTTADAVIGQTTFTTNLANQGGANGTAATMNGNRGLTVDNVSGRLWVADTSNNRVLGFVNAAAFINGESADVVIGQADFTGIQSNRGGANPAQNTISGPRGVAVDSASRLYVADTDNKRILRFDPPFTNGMNAVQVFGQAGSFTTANQAAMNAATADNLGNPEGVAVDANDNLYLADRFLSRVLRYNTPAAGAGDTTADLVIGQPNFTSGDSNQGGTPAANTINRASGCALDAAGNLYVCDEFNNRVLLYLAPLQNGQVAARVYGQPSFTTDTANNGGVSATSLSTPVSVCVDPVSGNMYIADSVNMRILEFTNPLTDSTADRVFGQQGDFTTNTVNKGGISADSINDVGGVVADSAGNLYAGDRLNSRVLRYNVAPAPPGGGDGGNGGGGDGGGGGMGGDGAMMPCGLCGTGTTMLMPIMLTAWIALRRTNRRRNR
ncbi:MAG: hypothetical protein HS101_08510 [Planctomycetia bacterium]|nr:hypothetical protein [Planctomycetia bacterium]MCC7315300.1 NHL repeat-containing protein [Planctomycetota bacterium]